MIISNELNIQYFVETAQMMFDLIAELHAQLGITISFVNFGGGIGIPYRPEEEPVDLEKLGQLVQACYEQTITAQGMAPLKITSTGSFVLCSNHHFAVLGTFKNLSLMRPDDYRTVWLPGDQSHSSQRHLQALYRR